MRRERALAILKRNEPELRCLGLQHLSLFGSTARGDDAESSDVDVAVQLVENSRIDLFAYAAIADQLRSMLGRPVDLVTEPSRNSRVQAMIERDRVNVF